MKPTLLFIHGMFLTARSWENWISFFEARGYDCVAPSWPLHDDDPAFLRSHLPEGTGELTLDEVIDHYVLIASHCAEKPILIGHSLGGLIAQRLVARDLAAAAICIASVAPNAMITADWSFLRNFTQIANPLKGNKPFEMTPEGFHRNFANTLSRSESTAAYERYAVHESRNVLRDAIGKAGHIDLDRPHVPLLFIAGEKDQIIPDKLDEKVASKYSDKDSIVDFLEFPNRGHFICGEPGWKDVAASASDWLDRNVLGPSFTVTGGNDRWRSS